MKAIDLYDYQSFETAIKTQVEDGQQGAFVKENLIELSKKIHTFVPYDVTFQQIGFNVDTSGGWANAVKSLRVVGEGGFKKSGTSSQTLGKISIGGDTNLIKIEGYEAESDYTVAELNQAKMENRNLPQELMRVHQMKYLRLLNELIFGKLANNDDYDRDTAPNKWKTMTDEELSNTLRNVVINQRNNVSSAYEANVLLVPKDLKLRCDSSDYKALTDLTISEKLAKTLGVKLVGSHLLSGVGAGDSDVAIALSNNEESAVIRLPKKFGVSPTHRIGNRFYFESYFRVGGVDILEAKSGLVLEGL